VLYQLSYASGELLTTAASYLLEAASYQLHYIYIGATHRPRAGDGTRTRDIKLGRLALYQLSYSRVRLFAEPYHTQKNPPLHPWWGKDSNLRRREPADLQSAPFGHSGTPPVFALCESSFVGRADGENRTPNLLITNQLLCQLSYVSNKQRIFIASLVE
jgi:hypothetical protein